MSVHSAVWNQSCLDIDDLKSSVACISFSPPMVTLDGVSETLSDCPDMKNNTHIVYIETDILPRLLQSSEFGKPQEGRVFGDSRQVLHYFFLAVFLISSYDTPLAQRASY